MDRTQNEIEVKVYSNQKQVTLYANGEKLAEAPGRSKKAAEQHAAKLALEKLR